MILEIGAAALAEKIVPMLLPLLPHLLKGAKDTGEKYAHALGEKSVKMAVDIAEKIWGKLSTKVEQDPATKKVILEAAADPTQGYLPGTLTYHLKSLLEDETLRKEVAEILAHSEKQGVQVESFIEAGQIYGEVTGIQVVNLDALEKAGLISSKIKTDLIGRGGKATGVIL